MLSPENNPWLGLESYSIKDAHRFYGRDRDIELVSNAIYDNFITTIYGISGAGKTSLLNAGLTPALIAENYLPIRVRLNHSSSKSYSTQIIEAVSHAIESIGGEVEYEGAISLEEVVEQEKLWFFLHTRHFWSKHNYSIRPVIFIDQFEELFTKNDDMYKISLFFEMINAIQYDTPPSNTKDLLENGTDYFELDCNTSRIVFVIREDFLARLEDYSYGIAALRRNRIGIKQMNGHQALEVILNPNPSLITREGALKILSKVSGKEVIDTDRSLGRLSVDTSILSLFCSEIYQRAVEENSNTITTNIIEEFGSNIISHFYTKCMSLVPSSLVTYLEKHLLTSNGFRNSVALEDIEIPKFTKDSVHNSLLLLSDKRIIRIEDTNGVERVEFTHDVLCKVAKQHRDNINKSKELKRNRWTSVHKSLDFLIILLLTYLSLKNGGHIINEQAATLMLLKPRVIAIGLLFYYAFLSKRSVVNPRVRLVSSIVLGVVLMDLPNTLTRLGYMDFIDYIIYLAFPLLTIPLSFIAFRKEAQGNNKLFLALLTIDVLSIAFQRLSDISGLLILFSFLILIPYRYSNDKKSYIFAIIGSILNLVYFLINDHDPLLVFVCVLYPLTYFVFKHKDSTSTFRSSLNSCLKLDVYQSHTYLKVILLLVGVVLLFTRSIRYGESMSEYQLFSGACVAGLIFVFLASIFKATSAKFRDFIDNKSDWCFWGGIITSIISILIFLCLYVPYGFLIIVLIWGGAGYVIYQIYKQSRFQSKTTSFILLTLISFISIICIPFNCIGYNITTHIQYARVPGTFLNAYGLSNELIIIKDIHGKYGVRDRYDVIVPVSYRDVVGVSFGYIEMNHQRGLFSYNYDKTNHYIYHHFPMFSTLVQRRINRLRSDTDTHTDTSDLPYISNSEFPSIRFTLVDDTDRTTVWECNQHLNDENLCTSLIMNTAVDRLSRHADIPYALELLSLLDKAGVNTTLHAKNIMEDIVKKLAAVTTYNSDGVISRYVHEDLMQYTLSDLIETFPSSFTYDEVQTSLKTSHKLLAYVNDSSFVKLILDTLYSQKLPKDVGAYERWKNYNNLSKFYMYGKMPELADKYASMAIQIDTLMKFSYLKKVEAYILDKRYEEAEALISKHGMDVHCEGPLWEGILKQDLYRNVDSTMSKIQYNFRGSLADDLSEFESVGLIKAPYDEAFLRILEIIGPTDESYNSAEIRGDYSLCRKYTSYDGPIGEYHKEYKLEYQYYMRDGKKISPCYKTYAEGINENVQLVIDEFSHKRVYINMIGKIPAIIPGEFDHAWRFSEGLAAVSNNGKLGFIDKSGDFVIDTTFVYRNNSQYAVDHYNRQQTHFVDFTFHNDLCPMVDNNSKYGLISKTGDWVLEAKYDDIEFLKPFNIWLLKEIKESFILYGAADSQGNIIVPIENENFITIDDDKACWGVGDIYSVLKAGTQNVENEYLIKSVRDEYTSQSEWFITYPSGKIEKYTDSIVDSTWRNSSCH